MVSVGSNHVITVTPRALSKIRELRVGDQGLRVAVVGGGCSGMSYKLSWVDAANDGDVIGLFDELCIVIDPKSVLFLKGMELDHSDGLDGVGFTFNNPNAKRSCGCGSSFST